MLKSTRSRALKVGIVRFPCSNCDFDALRFFQKFGHHPEFIWYTETKLRQFDLLVLPGGFAFGDRVYKKATGKFVIDPGAQALSSPVKEVVKKAAKADIPILGICNGFQILVKYGLLPGKLSQNTSKKFFCDWTTCQVVGSGVFGDKSLLGKKLKLPVAHGYGRYVVTEKQYQDLKENNQVFVEYVDINPNGSYKNIAGVSNKEGNIFGLMPHPERSPDGKYFMEAIEKYANR